MVHYPQTGRQGPCSSRCWGGRVEVLSCEAGLWVDTFENGRELDISLVGFILFFTYSILPVGRIVGSCIQPQHVLIK